MNSGCEDLRWPVELARLIEQVDHFQAARSRTIRRETLTSASAEPGASTQELVGQQR